MAAPPQLAIKKIIDLAEVRRMLEVLIASSQVVELRALHAITREYNRPHTVSGYFNDANALASSLKSITDARGIYITINPCQPELLARANNRIRQDRDIATTTDANITMRRWLVLDIDPKRAGNIDGIPANEVEHRAALTRAQEIRDALAADGWPEPVEINSGNGAYLLYAIDLPTQDDGLVKRVLEGLARRFNDRLVEIDTSVFNPARIIRLCGTWNCKGDAFEDRQHRMATLINLPDRVQVVLPELLEAATVPATTQEAKNTTSARQTSNSANRAWALKALHNECRNVTSTAVGHRNKQLNKSAHALGQIVGGGSLSRSEVERELTNTAISAGLSEAEIEKTLRSGIEAGMKEPRSAPAQEQIYSPTPPTHSSNGNGNNGSVPPSTGLNLCSFSADDAGNGDAMFALFGQDFLYCSSRGWFAHDKTHWQLDADAAEVKKKAVETLRLRRHAAIDSKREDIVKCTVANENRVNGCVSRFKTLVSVSIDEFDTHPDKLNCQSGVVDLHTGDIEKHTREQRFTYCLPVEFDQADYFEWVDYLNGVIGGGQVVIDYLQMALGYSFTGHTQEEILFYLFGPTRSGKGTFAETIMALLPTPISKMVDFNSFTAKREGDVSNFDLAPLKPSRIIFASESNKSQSLNPAKIKQLTGGDHITCCFKHRDFFSYRPQFKVWMMSNHPVNGDPEDDALWGRVRVIEFPNSFLGMEDKTKKARLKSPEALKGVLWWIVEGAIKWYALGSKGLTTPDIIAETTQAHRNELDFVQQWLDECCEDLDGGWTANEDVTTSYTQWCDNNNVQYPKGPKSLAQSLKAKGYIPGDVRKIDKKSKRGVGGLYVYPETYQKKEAQ